MSPHKVTPLIRLVSPSLLVLMVGLVYWGSQTHEFTYDDHYVVASNALVKTVDPGAIFGSPFWRGFESEGSGTYYRPVTILSYANDFQLFGMNPAGFHVTNVFLHALTVLLVFVLGRRLIRSDRAALAAGLIFAVHPVLTEAVSSVSGRSDILVAAFSLTALLCHLSRRRVLNVLTCVPVLLAMLSKEIGLILPCLLVVADVVWPRVTQNRLIDRIGQITRTNAPALAMVGVFAGLRWWAVGNLGTVNPSPLDNPLVEHGFWTSVFTLPVVLFHYGRLLLLPLSLSVDYGFNQIPVQTGPSLYLIGGVGVLAVLYQCRERILASPTAILSLSVLCLPILATANPFLNAGSILSERYLYFPTAGLALLVAAAAHKFRPAAFGDVARRRAGWSVLLVIVSLGAFRTADRNDDWRTDESLFRSAVETAPNSVRANLNYAEILSSQGDHLSASRHYEHVLALKPDYPIVNLKLARSLQLAGQPERALHFFAATTRLSPAFADAWRGIATISLGLGRDAEAEHALMQAISLTPNNASLYNQLGVVYQRGGRHREAVQAYQRALAGDYHHPGIYCNLGIIYKENGELDRARKAFDTALKISPEMTLVHYHLGALEQLTGNTARAITHFEAFVSGWQENPDIVRQVQNTLRDLKRSS